MSYIQENFDWIVNVRGTNFSRDIKLLHKKVRNAVNKKLNKSIKDIEINGYSEERKQRCLHHLNNLKRRTHGNQEHYLKMKSIVNNLIETGKEE